MAEKVAPGGNLAGSWQRAPEAYWSSPVAEVLDAVASDTGGLSEQEAASRLATAGPNRLAPPKHTGISHELWRQFTQPPMLILMTAAILAFALGDATDAVIILGIVLLSGLLGFWQEHQAALTVAKLLDRVHVTVEVRRSGKIVSVQPTHLVPGDILVLNAGDIVPADCRVLTGDALMLDQAVLTGESYPRHKHPEPAELDAPLAERHSALLEGSHVVSGKGEAVVVATAGQTVLGAMSKDLAAPPTTTAFEKGTAGFGLLIAATTAGLTALILVINLSLHRPFIDSVLFSLALAVGVTPQMLPAIVSVSLSAGARRLARAKVIVKRLDAIEDLGSMDVLCTDKTGTLTEGTLALNAALDTSGQESALVAQRALLNSAMQTGFANPLDTALIAKLGVPGAEWHALAEIPFDFDR